jgi:hypothetical protein
MNDRNPSLKGDLARLGDGVGRTLFRDLRLIAILGAAGASIGAAGALYLGLAAWTGVKFGALSGFAIAILARSATSTLFDYKTPPKP